MSAPVDLGLRTKEQLACVSCRSRKLKCDRVKPACARCLRVGSACVYPASRRKPTFKRRNVKDLEARLAQVEDYLSQVNGNGSGDVPVLGLDEVFPPEPTSGVNAGISDPPISLDVPSADDGLFDGVGGELVGLGLFETLPPLDVMEELNNHFFETQYHYLPIVHRGRYLGKLLGPASGKPPMCLQYAVWAAAAGGHAKYDQHADVFYKRARRYVEEDEMRGDGEHFITLAHAQAWAIIATYEAKCMLYTRACMSSARCSRLAHMMGLDRLDKEDDEVPPTLAPATSWTELEERRRVFWGAFAIDAQASISTGWPGSIRSDEVVTRLPSSEEAFASGAEEKTPFLDDVFQGAPFGGFSAAVVVRHMFKTISAHIRNVKPADRPDDLARGEFWNRHRRLDANIASLFTFMPDALRIPRSVGDPSAVQVHLNLHASVICLHHAAIDMVDKHRLPDTVKYKSLARLKGAAQEIVNIIKMTSHHAALFKNQLCALCLYCATTVYVYIAKSSPTHTLAPSDSSNLTIVIKAMEAVGRAHTATCAFLQQVCLDIERNGLAGSIRLPSLAQYRDMFGGPASHIPLLARSAVSRHTEASTPLPGRLPLDQPRGTPRAMDLKLAKVLPSLTGAGPVERSIREEMASSIPGGAETTEGGIFSRMTEMYGGFAGRDWVPLDV